MIYCWKCLSAFAPNCGIQELEGSAVSRFGRRLRVPINKSNAKYEKLREQSFKYNGPLVFKRIPAKLRNMNNCTMEECKTELDNYIETVPVEPKMDGQNPNSSEIIGNWVDLLNL